jgi:hypothetical protein
MTHNTTDTVRAALRAAEDGMTLNEIAEKVGLPYRAVHRAVPKMPDAYIDRWRPPNGAYPHQAVWCVVIPPPNCPHPREKT